ncbi:MAG: glycosyltransferase family 1 protein [Phycisphaeraceae bacterium]|nr:glycosyltransferase family 1 protein [Phycisphaeraceae bacterium]
MHVLIATIGSGGDVFPYLGVGRALVARGHRVTVLTNPRFRDHVADAGLAFEPCGTVEEYDRAIAHPDLVHPRRAPAHVVRMLVETPSREMYARSRWLIRRQGVNLVLRHLIAMAAGWAARTEGVTEAVGTLAPLFWMSCHDPSQYRKRQRDRLPRWLARVRMAVGRAAARWVFDPAINRARRDLGLPPLRHAFVGEISGRGLNLGLWSPRFRPPAADDPVHGRICGFSWHDGGHQRPLPPELEAFIDRGPPPVVFTLGTSVVHHAGDFYAHALTACRRLGRRALLVGAPPRDDLGPDALAVGFAPFSALLPRALVTVHHGGIGTTAQALRAGRPMLIAPFANDEFDNAARARRLGVSATLDPARLDASSLERSIRTLLDDPAPAARAADIAKHLHHEDGAANAAALLEQFAGQPSRAEHSPGGPTDLSRHV